MRRRAVRTCTATVVPAELSRKPRRERVAHRIGSTKLAFLAGVLFTSWGQSTRSGTRERQALLNTIGHLDWMQTHEPSTPLLKLRATRQPRIAPQPGQITRRQRVVTGRPELDFPLGARLTLLQDRDLHNPFWVVGATPTVVDGHNGILVMCSSTSYFTSSSIPRCTTGGLRECRSPLTARSSPARSPPAAPPKPGSTNLAALMDWQLFAYRRRRRRIDPGPAIPSADRKEIKR